MTTAYLIVTWLAIVMNAGIAVCDYARAPFVLANSGAVNVPPGWLPVLATLKAAGAAGLVLGLLGAAYVGAAAAAGLVLFFVGAIVAHARAGRLSTSGAAGFYLAVAAACLVLGLIR